MTSASQAIPPSAPGRIDAAPERVPILHPVSRAGRSSELSRTPVLALIVTLPGLFVGSVIAVRHEHQSAAAVQNSSM